MVHDTTKIHPGNRPALLLTIKILSGLTRPFKAKNSRTSVRPAYNLLLHCHKRLYVRGLCPVMRFGEQRLGLRFQPSKNCLRSWRNRLVAKYPAPLLISLAWRAKRVTEVFHSFSLTWRQRSMESSRPRIENSFHSQPNEIRTFSCNCGLARMLSWQAPG